MRGLPYAYDTDFGNNSLGPFNATKRIRRPLKLAADKDGWIWMPEQGFSNAFAHHATANQIALCKAVQRPIALRCIQETGPKPAWRSKPSWFLIAEEDRMINPKTQHFMANRMQARNHRFAVDHAPLLTAPDKVLEVIIAAAQQTLSERTQSPSFDATL